MGSSPLSTELLACADSVFAKERADLVLAGRPDSSGQSVEHRRRCIKADHHAEDYRIVPAETLRRAAAAIDQNALELRTYASILAEFMATVDQSSWPAALIRVTRELHAQDCPERAVASHLVGSDQVK